MITKSTYYIAAFVLSFIITNNAKGQIAISNIDEIEKVKSGTTYIVMKDPNSEKVKEFVDVYKSSWTISKIEFIKYTDLDKYLSPENSFFTIGGYATTTELSTLYKGVSNESNVNYTITHIYLELWTVNKKYFESIKKKPRAFAYYDQITIARIDLFTDYPTLADPNKIYQTDYDGDGHIRNLGPGILKNYIQSLMSHLNKNEERSLYSGTFNEQEMKNLRKGTLYVPDYTLIKFNKFTGDETKRHKEEEIFGDYKLKYQLLTTEDLNQKILSDKTGFYYMIYVKSCTDKFITVINSLTGEIVYAKYSGLSYNIKEDDLNDLQKKIVKN